MKTLEPKRWLPSPIHTHYISGPAVVENDYNALESIHTPRGQIRKFDVFFIERTAEHRTLLSLDASLAIPPRVLRFGPSQRPRLPPVRQVWSTGQTGPALLSTRRASGLGFRLNQGTSSGFVVNHW